MSRADMHSLGSFLATHSQIMSTVAQEHRIPMSPVPGSPARLTMRVGPTCTSLGARVLTASRGHLFFGARTNF